MASLLSFSLETIVSALCLNWWDHGAELLLGNACRLARPPVNSLVRLLKPRQQLFIQLIRIVHRKVVLSQGIGLLHAAAVRLGVLEFLDPLFGVELCRTVSEEDGAADRIEVVRGVAGDSLAEPSVVVGVPLLGFDFAWR